MTEEDEKMTTDEWLNEHDSIQFELLKIKEEIVKDIIEEKNEGNDKDEEPSGTIQRKSESSDLRRIMEASPLPMPPSSLDRPEEQDLSTRDLPKIRERDRKVQSAPKLPEGKIPTSPDLTNKIASVLQLESKLKRRKYEMEKSERGEKKTVSILRSRPSRKSSPIETTPEEPLSMKENAPTESPSEPTQRSPIYPIPGESGSKVIEDWPPEPAKENIDLESMIEPIKKKEKSSIRKIFRRRVFFRKN